MRRHEQGDRLITEGWTDHGIEENVSNADCVHQEQRSRVRQPSSHHQASYLNKGEGEQPQERHRSDLPLAVSCLTDVGAAVSFTVEVVNSPDGLPCRSIVFENGEIPQDQGKETHHRPILCLTKQLKSWIIVRTEHCIKCVVSDGYQMGVKGIT